MSDQGEEDALEVQRLDDKVKARRVLNQLEKQEVEAFRRRASFPTLSMSYVGGEGSLHGAVAMVIGEAPGAQEDQQKRPFIGQSGLVLRQLMLSGGLSPGTTPFFGDSNCWITNVVKYRPPMNRNPTWPEIMSFRTLLRAEWVVIGHPRIIIPIGGIALSAIHGRRVSIMKHAGKMAIHQSKEGYELKIWPMIHPSFGLRNEAIRPIMERDWDRFGKWFSDQNHE